MAPLTATEARANLYRLIDEAAVSHQVLDEDRVVKVLRMWSHYE